MNPDGGDRKAGSHTVCGDGERPRKKNAPNPAHFVPGFGAFRLRPGNNRLSGRLDVEAELHDVPVLGNLLMTTWSLHTRRFLFQS
ncbi:hypothetical protein JOF47_002296 [Paeniglutamicibacter kerguelensis]|uniref:Uncharacterized protein n=1 Tax=Paeniglutamicibacter kerguelensis TaxID=254788 RepID=A0ABS4XEA1_9MICC|nr:hypothetical protein [Paeniglutamicibacter kerguelensis]